MVRHLAECNKKANLGKNIKNIFRKPFLDLECSNFTENVSRLIRNYCKITFFYTENRPTLMRICVFFIRITYFLYAYFTRIFLRISAVFYACVKKYGYAYKSYASAEGPKVPD